MKENFSYSVKRFNEDENLTLAVWLYNLLSNTDDLDEKNDTLGIFRSLVSSLKLEEHYNKIVKAFIKRHIKNGVLNVDEDDGSDRNPYYCEEPVLDHYREDGNLSGLADNWCQRRNKDVDFIRAVFADKKHCFDEIIFCTFFCKPSDSENFRIPKSIGGMSNAKFKKYFLLSENTDRIKVISDAFELSKDESRILNFAYLLAEVKEFNRLRSCYYATELFECCLGFSQREIRKNLLASGKLVSLGLMEDDGSVPETVIDAIYANDLNLLFSDLLKKDETKREIYSLDSFSVKESERNLALRLLKSNTTVNILFHGAPGAGKTQFARSIVKASGKKIFFYNNEAEVEEGGAGKAVKRLNAYLSLHHNDSVLIVDEAENILATMNFSFLGRTIDRDKKALVNSMLENSNASVIWILNYKNTLDESTLRRFAYDIKFGQMSNAMLKRIAASRLKELSVSDELQSRLVDLCGKYKVTGASVDNVIKTVKGMNLSLDSEREVLDDVKTILQSNSILVYGESKMRSTVCKSYDLSVLNSSIKADKIVSMVHNAVRYAEENGNIVSSGIRILFYGASGTGKTELARYIAEKMDKRLLVKRASDIMGKYVGQNEENIKNAFEEAVQSDSILLFDEADSFFTDRNLAGNSWERTLVNEFLTQMEEFPGILICTTNLKKIMDPAMERRFHIKSEFKPLDFVGTKKMLEKYFHKLEFTDSQIDELADYETVTPGDFGALAGRIRFMDSEDITSDFIIKELCDAQESKNGRRERRMGFAC